jgi:hypothetical protein
MEVGTTAGGWAAQLELKYRRSLPEPFSWVEYAHVTPELKTPSCLRASLRRPQRQAVATDRPRRAGSDSDDCVVRRLDPAGGHGPGVGRATEPVPRVPGELLATAGLDNIPALGPDTGFVVDRIALVQRSGNKVLLRDPFSDTVYREANDEEKELVGDRPYVIDSYGQPADRQLMLTFDDGPDARFTPELLDLLSKESVPVPLGLLGAR